MPKVRLKIWPDREVEVDDREFQSLKQGDMLLEEAEDEAEDAKDLEKDRRLAELEKKRQAKSQAKSTEGS
jgi:hypothetical protein